MIIVTVFAEGRLARELLGLGASGYLVKNASMLNLLNTVRSVAHGQAQDSLTVSMPRTIFEGEGAREGAECKLSRRQLEVLTLAARGMSNREAAEELQLSESTIKRHLADTYKKLGVGARGEAARKAMSEGWISSAKYSATNSGLQGTVTEPGKDHTRLAPTHPTDHSTMQIADMCVINIDVVAIYATVIYVYGTWRQF